ncbi:MAG: EamA family transporter [Promethearchaeota archaeon]
MAELIGYFLAIDAIITWGLASLVYKTGLEKTDPKATLLFRLVIVSGFTFIISIFFGNYYFFSKLSEQQLFEYLFMCFLSGICVTIGDICYFVSLKKIDASRAYPLTQLSLVFVIPFAFIFYNEKITFSIIIGGALILSSVFFLGSKDKFEEEQTLNILNRKEKSEDIYIGVLLAIGTALFWALAIIAFHRARIISEDVFITNFFRIFFATIVITILGIFQREYYEGFKKENRKDLKYYCYIGIAGSLSLGLADSLFYKAAEINGLILTSAITASTPVVQQTMAIIILKEKFRKRFLFAIFLIILGNYLILFF